MWVVNHRRWEMFLIIRFVTDYGRTCGTIHDPRGNFFIRFLHPPAIQGDLAIFISYVQPGIHFTAGLRMHVGTWSLGQRECALKNAGVCVWWRSQNNMHPLTRQVDGPTG